MPVSEAIKKISEFYEKNKDVRITFDMLSDFCTSSVFSLKQEDKKEVMRTDLWSKFSKKFSYVLRDISPKDERDTDKKIYDALCGQRVTAVLFGKKSVYLQFFNGTHLWISKGIINSDRESFPVPVQRLKKEATSVI